MELDARGSKLAQTARIDLTAKSRHTNIKDDVHTGICVQLISKQTKLSTH